MRLKRNAPAADVRARRVLRREVDWQTRYMFEGAGDQEWRTCRVLDISRGGAGVELFATTVDEARTHRVVLEFELAPAVFRLRGEVRHASLSDAGTVHVGLQFASLTAIERYMFDTLLERDTAR
jgi:hypothetical protein